MTFDGAGGFTRSYNKNADGVVTAVSDSGSYLVASNGAIRLSVIGGPTLSARLNSAGDTIVFSSPTGTDPRFNIAGKRLPGPYTVASLNGTGDYFCYGYNGSLAQPAAPVVGASLPTPNGFQTLQGTVAFNGAGAYTLNAVVNQDSVGSSGTVTGTYTVASDGTVTLTSTGKSTPDDQGTLVNGDTLLIAAANGHFPQICAGSLQTGTYSNANLAGRYALIDRYFDTGVARSLMPAVGTPLPVLKGLTAGLGSFGADGAGNWTFTNAKNVDSVMNFPVSYGGTYSVASDGTLTINSPGAVLTGSVLNAGEDFHFVNPAGNVPEPVFATRIPPPTTAFDLTGEGNADLLYRHTSGYLYSLNMNGTSIASEGGLGLMPAGWTLIGRGDLDGDGMTDLVWQHTSGYIWIWLMNGTTIKAQGGFGSLDTTNWKIVGIADLDGDGKADLIYQHVSGYLYALHMNGTSIASQGGLGLMPAGWSLVGFGDLNGDGKADLVWQHTSGYIWIWLMNGNAISSQAGFGSLDTTNWRIVGISDLDGDGKADLIYQHVSGYLYALHMNGTSIASQGGLGLMPAGWTLTALEDVDGDGTTDLVWQHTSGYLWFWLMNGNAIATQGGFGSLDPANWSLLAR